MSEIDVSKYFKTYRNDDGFLFAIKTIGDERELIKEIRKQNEQLQQLKIKNDELKEIRENLHKCNKKIMDEKHNISIKNIKYKQCLDEIEKIIKDTCFEECDFKWCKGKKHCGDDDCRYMQIMEKIKQAKETEHEKN